GRNAGTPRGRAPAPPARRRSRRTGCRRRKSGGRARRARPGRGTEGRRGSFDGSAAPRRLTPEAEARGVLAAPGDEHGEDEDGAGDDLLPEGGDAGDAEAVLERADEEDADGGADDAADAADEAGAAEQDGCGRFEWDLGADERAGGAEPSGLDHGAEGG